MTVTTIIITIIFFLNNLLLLKLTNHGLRSNVGNTKVPAGDST